MPIESCDSHDIETKQLFSYNSDSDLLQERSEFVNSSAWRVFPKVSLNSWLKGRGEARYLMICMGSDGSNPESVFLHNSDDLINWSNEAILVFTGIKVVGNYSLYKRYPTLVGDVGQSSLTSEHNMLYYQRDHLIPNPSDPNKWIMDEQNLFRQTLCIEK
jgi:hypothetical protein